MFFRTDHSSCQVELDVLSQCVGESLTGFERGLRRMSTTELYYFPDWSSRGQKERGRARNIRARADNAAWGTRGLTFYLDVQSAGPWVVFLWPCHHAARGSAAASQMGL